MKYVIYWTADLKSSKLWASQLWTQSKQLLIEAWNSQDFNGVWTRDLAMGFNEPVGNECEVIYEFFFFYILN